VAHNVSVMTIQAAAAGDVFASHPGRAREALGSIETTGREALAELRRLLGAVHGREDGDGPRAPQPGLARLDELLDHVRRAGPAVELRTNCVPSELPALVDLSAYRIVQESLTNALRHAGAAAITVVLRQGSDALAIEVLDDGAGPGAARGDDRGRGLIGMAERAALLGGELHAGPRPGGGFAVTARLPLGEGSS
jgi:signal transduction histidine kinase